MLITIAIRCSCSVSTVQRALREFSKEGWICWQKRPYLSNLYFVADELMNLELNNSKIYSRNDHQCDHVSELHCSLNVNISTEEVSVPKELEKRKLTPQQMLAFAPIKAKSSFDKLTLWVNANLITPLERARLCLSFSEFSLDMAMIGLKYTRSKGFIPKSYAAVLWNIASKNQ